MWKRKMEAEAINFRFFVEAEALWWKRLEAEANSEVTNSIQSRKQKNSKGEEAEANLEA